MGAILHPVMLSVKPYFRKIIRLDYSKHSRLIPACNRNQRWLGEVKCSSFHGGLESALRLGENGVSGPKSKGICKLRTKAGPAREAAVARHVRTETHALHVARASLFAGA